ncbi:MAG: hypothetical protein CBE00_04695 [Planctomycetaceae bacterium TMED240]|nr:hypothetical protein [Rhodopirellula sp.]OUX07525.1 MAG: hypothetical protein CBE00_04695 [Planctomycetaceae bacterium TMED240]
MSLEQITVLLGWSTVLNFGVLMLTAMMLTLFRKTVHGIHTKMSGLSADELNKLYFQYMGNFKILWILFNLTPYLVIRIFMLSSGS